MKMHPRGTIGVVYLARGADDDCLSKFLQFVESYRKWPAGIDHNLYVLFKGFRSAADLLKAQGIFGAVRHKHLIIDDDSFDIGAYADASRQMDEQHALFLNTNASVISDGWLYKLHAGLLSTDGCVGATGSFEQLELDGTVEVAFPNVHLRTNGFMLSVPHFREIVTGYSFSCKRDLYELEAGASSLTKRVLARGLSIAVVGRDGRAYSPEWWPISDTFRQRAQENLLIEDNQTRMYAHATWQEKRFLCERTWGRYLDPACGQIIGFAPDMARPEPRYLEALV